MSAALAKALVAAQKSMPSVDKTGQSNFGAHVTLDHLIARTRQHLADNGLSILQFPAVSELGAPTLRTILLHESGESIEADTPLYLGERQTMQALGGAITYARRYGWSAVLGISTEADDDGDAVSLAKSAAEKPAAKVKPPASVAADKTQVETIEVLIADLNGAGVLTEVQTRDGMKRKYGTEVSAELTRLQADELINSLSAKKMSVAA